MKQYFDSKQLTSNSVPSSASSSSSSGAVVSWCLFTSLPTTVASSRSFVSEPEANTATTTNKSDRGGILISKGYNSLVNGQFRECSIPST